MLYLVAPAASLSLTSPRSTDTAGLFRDPVDYAESPAQLADPGAHEIHALLSGEVAVGHLGAGYVGSGRGTLLIFGELAVAATTRTVEEDAVDAGETGLVTEESGARYSDTSLVVAWGSGRWGLSARAEFGATTATALVDGSGDLVIGGALTTTSGDGTETTGEYRYRRRSLAVWGGFRTSGVEEGHALHFGVREARGLTQVDATWTSGENAYSVKGFYPGANAEQFGPAARWEMWAPLGGTARVRLDVDGSVWIGTDAKARRTEVFTGGGDTETVVTVRSEDRTLGWDGEVLVALDLPLEGVHARIGASAAVEDDHTAWKESVGDVAETWEIADRDWAFGPRAAIEVPVGTRWTVRAGSRASFLVSDGEQVTKTEAGEEHETTWSTSTWAAGSLGVRFEPAASLRIDVSAGASGTWSAGGETTSAVASGTTALFLDGFRVEVVGRF